MFVWGRAARPQLATKGGFLSSQGLLGPHAQEEISSLILPAPAKWGAASSQAEVLSLFYF